MHKFLSLSLFSTLFTALQLYTGDAAISKDPTFFPEQEFFLCAYVKHGLPEDINPIFLCHFLRLNETNRKLHDDFQSDLLKLLRDRLPPTHLKSFSFNPLGSLGYEDDLKKTKIEHKIVGNFFYPTKNSKQWRKITQVNNRSTAQFYQMIELLPDKEARPLLEPNKFVIDVELCTSKQTGKKAELVWVPQQ